MATDLRTEMKKWGVKEGAESKIRQAIDTEWQMADIQHKEGELEAHGNGMGLIGIWTNKTLQRMIKILTEDMKWSEEVSMEKAKDLAFINMGGATKIDKKISNMKQSMYDQVQPIEKELWKFAKGKANNWMDIKITETELKFTDTIKQRMQWNGKMIMDYMVKQMEAKIMQGKEEKKEKTQEKKGNTMLQDRIKKKELNKQTLKRKRQVDKQQKQETKQVREQGVEYSSGMAGDGPCPLKQWAYAPLEIGGSPGTQFPGGRVGKTTNPKYYTTLHYTTLHYTPVELTFD